MRRRDFLRTLVASGAAAALGTLPPQLTGPALPQVRVPSIPWGGIVVDPGWPASVKLQAQSAENVINTARAALDALATFGLGPAGAVALRAVAATGIANEAAIWSRPLDEVADG